jgi:hypothetical protein
MVKVTHVEPRENHTLYVKLSNGIDGIFDVRPYLELGIFTELKDENYFTKVKAAFGGVMWPNEQDFSPETIEHELFIGHQNIGKEANDGLKRTSTPA